MTLSEKLVEWVDRALTRRQFLTRLGGATLGIVLAFISPQFVKEAYAYYEYGCCKLCMPPASTPCPSGCPSPTSLGRWCWYCTDSRSGFSFLCCECLKINTPCLPDCNNVYQSYVVFYGRTSPDT